MKKVILAGIMSMALGIAVVAQETTPPAGQAPASETPLAKQPQPKSQAELEALQALFGAQDPDARIKAADELIAKFADTEFKPYALLFAAESYRQKNDFERMVVYAERTLEADPKNFTAMIMLAQGFAQRTREHDLDKEEKLARAEKLAKDAQQTIKDAPRPNPQITDEQWADAKKDFTGQAHEALGMVALARKKYDEAATQFKLAVDSSSQPDHATLVRLAAAYNQSGKYDEALTILEKLMADPNVHPTIKQFAQAERVRATQGKSGGAQPGAQAGETPAPPQVEIKKQ
jgi:tetratricopeptide (TPR) repeat protein